MKGNMNYKNSEFSLGNKDNTQIIYPDTNDTVYSSVS